MCSLLNEWVVIKTLFPLLYEPLPAAARAGLVCFINTSSDNRSPHIQTATVSHFWEHTNADGVNRLWLEWPQISHSTAVITEEMCLAEMWSKYKQADVHLQHCEEEFRAESRPVLWFNQNQADAKISLQSQGHHKRGNTRTTKIALWCPMTAERSPSVATKLKTAFQFSVFRGAKRNWWNLWVKQRQVTLNWWLFNGRLRRVCARQQNPMQMKRLTRHIC